MNETTPDVTLVIDPSDALAPPTAQVVRFTRISCVSRLLMSVQEAAASSSELQTRLRKICQMNEFVNRRKNVLIDLFDMVKNLLLEPIKCLLIDNNVPWSSASFSFIPLSTNTSLYPSLLLCCFFTQWFSWKEFWVITKLNCFFKVKLRENFSR